MSKTEELAPGMLPELVKLSGFCAKCSELLKAENILEHPACSEALTALLNMLEDVLDAIKKSIQSEVDAITIILSKREDLLRGIRESLTVQYTVSVSLYPVGSIQFSNESLVLVGQWPLAVYSLQFTDEGTKKYRSSVHLLKWLFRGTG